MPKTFRRKHTVLTFTGYPVYCRLSRPLVVQRVSQKSLLRNCRNGSNLEILHAVGPANLTVFVGLEDPSVKGENLITLDSSNLAEDAEPIEISAGLSQTAVQRADGLVVERLKLVLTHRTLPERRNGDFHKTVSLGRVGRDVEKLGVPKLLGIRKSFLKEREDELFLLHKGETNPHTITQLLHPRILHRLNKGQASVVANLVLPGELDVFSSHADIRFEGLNSQSHRWWIYILSTLIVENGNNAGPRFAINENNLVFDGNDLKILTSIELVETPHTSFVDRDLYLPNTVQLNVNRVKISSVIGFTEESYVGDDIANTESGPFTDRRSENAVLDLANSRLRRALIDSEAINVFHIDNVFVTENTQPKPILPH